MSLTTDVLARNNVRVWGSETGPVVIFAQGFGCDRGTWQRMLPHFTDRYRVVTFDHVGGGESDVAAYDAVKYSTLNGYAADLLEICAALDLRDVTLVAHSFSAMMAITLASKNPEWLGRLVLLAASPSYLDHPEDGYPGGFTGRDMDELLAALDTNYQVWAAAAAPLIMGTPDHPQNAAELEASFRRLNPRVAREFARVAFHSDVRHLLKAVTVPSLILQCTNDLLVPPRVAEYLHRNLAHSTLVYLAATGHCPHLSAPQETAGAILAHLGSWSPVSTADSCR